MPAVKLSRQFYERFGDKLVNELVEMVNQVVTASRTEFREQNDLNFARFDAKLELRLGELAEQIAKRLEDRFEKRFALIEARMDRLEQRMDQLTRLFLLAWVTQMATIIGLGLR